MTNRPKINSQGNQELEKLQSQFDDFKENVDQLTLDRMNSAPKMEMDSQTKISSREISKNKDIYLKPDRTIPARDKFNENFRDGYNYSKEYVQFIAENKEIIGETIEMWTRPYGGTPAEFWKVPVNKPVWGPRYLAEQIKKCSYHRLTMSNVVTETTGVGNMYGTLVADSTIQRLDAIPVSPRKSIFMGASVG